MADPSAFERPSVEGFLADQLRDGRLALVLGAGVSFGYNLPNWKNLTEGSAVVCGHRLNPAHSVEQQGEDVWVACGRDEIKFAEVVRKALYEDFNTGYGELANNSLMRALGAMSMPSKRGSVSRIISFNFDDLLERYLRYSGFTVNVASDEPSWDTSDDLSVYHLHGLLPSDLSEPVTPIVFAQIQFDTFRAMWPARRRRALSVLSGSTCLFIGLSGNDSNLRGWLTDVKSRHASSSHGHAYWGIRLSDKADDPLREMWAERGVFQITIDYKEVPDFLLGVCQLAAQQASGSIR